MIRVLLPAHLRTLAGVNDEVQLEIPGEVTQRSVLDALEARYPTLRGTVRDQGTQKRRPLVRSSLAPKTYPTSRPILLCRSWSSKEPSLFAL